MNNMKPTTLKELGYPSNILELIENCEGVSLIEQTDDYYVVLDDYSDVDRVLQINKEAGFKEHYFAFFNNEVNQQEIYAFAKNLPSLLFMNLNK